MINVFHIKETMQSSLACGTLNSAAMQRIFIDTEISFISGIRLKNYLFCILFGEQTLSLIDFELFSTQALVKRFIFCAKG